MTAQLPPTGLTLSRAQWRANPPSVTAGAVVPLERFVGLVMHHDVIGVPPDAHYVPSANIEDVIEHAQAVQRARPDLYVDVAGRPEWPYSFGIAEHPDPELAWIVEGRGLGRTGAHTAGYNSTRYGVVLFGNYSARPMTPGMVRAFREIGQWALAPAVDAGKLLEPTYGHRQLAPPGEPTACPGLGSFAALDRLQPPFKEGPPDMELTDPITLRALKDPQRDPAAYVDDPSTVAGALEFGHYEAAQAHAWAQNSAAWAAQSAASAAACLKAIQEAPAQTVGAEAIVAALRAVLTPELVAGAMLTMFEHLTAKPPA